MSVEGASIARIHFKVRIVTARNHWWFLPEDSKTLQGDWQRRWRVFGNLQEGWRFSWRWLTAGWALKIVTGIEKVSLTVTEKTKSLKLLERLRNLSITYSDAERVENDQRSWRVTMMIKQSTRVVEEYDTEWACRGIANIACTNTTETIRMLNKEEISVVIV